MSLSQPTYDRRAPKLTLHVGGVSEEADSKFIEMKFGVFGSIGEVKFLRDKNIGKFSSKKCINVLCRILI